MVKTEKPAPGQHVGAKNEPKKVPNPAPVQVSVLEKVSGDGRFHCGIHNFRTDSEDAYNKHLDEKGHPVQGGRKPCFVCGDVVEFSEHLHETKFAKQGKVFHPQCKKEFFKDVS